jgi:hypothetical protein
MTQEEINQRKAELNEEAAYFKDRYIDEIRNVTAKFNTDWSRIMTFLNKLAEEERKQDKEIK